MGRRQISPANDLLYTTVEFTKIPGGYLQKTLRRYMTRSKKIFLLLAALFLLIMLYISYDIAQRTTFPGSKPNLKERIEAQDS